MKQRIMNIHREHAKAEAIRPRVYLDHEIMSWGFYREEKGDPFVWYYKSPDKHYFWRVTDHNGYTFYFQVKEFVVNFCINGAARGAGLSAPQRVHPHVDGP